MYFVLFADATVTNVPTTVLGAIVVVATMLFGWLKVRDGGRLTTVEELSKIQQQEIDGLKKTEKDLRVQLEDCKQGRAELAVQLARLEERVTFLATAKKPA